MLLNIQERDGIKPIIPERDPITILFFFTLFSEFLFILTMPVKHFEVDRAAMFSTSFQS